MSEIAKYNTIVNNEHRYEIVDAIFIEFSEEQPIRLIWRDQVNYVKNEIIRILYTPCLQQQKREFVYLKI